MSGYPRNTLVALGVLLDISYLTQQLFVSDVSRIFEMKTFWIPLCLRHIVLHF